MQSHINMQTYYGSKQRFVFMASKISMVTGAGSLEYDPNVPFRMCKSCSVCQDAEFGLNFTAFGWSVLRTKCRSIWYPLGLAHSTCSSNEYLGTRHCESQRSKNLTLMIAFTWCPASSLCKAARFWWPQPVPKDLSSLRWCR